MFQVKAEKVQRPGGSLLAPRKTVEESPDLNTSLWGKRQGWQEMFKGTFQAPDLKTATAAMEKVAEALGGKLSAPQLHLLETSQSVSLTVENGKVFLSTRDSLNMPAKFCLSDAEKIDVTQKGPNLFLSIKRKPGPDGESLIDKIIAPIKGKRVMHRTTTPRGNPPSSLSGLCKALFGS